MNQPMCDMCGSTDVVEQDGVLVCRACGAKCSADPVGETQAQTARISGKKNLRLMAKRAADNDDVEAAAKYYALLSEENPEDLKAYFYAAYYTIRQSAGSDTVAVAERLTAALYTVFDRMCRDFANANPDDFLTAVEVTSQISKLCDELIQSAKAEYGKGPVGGDAALQLDARMKAIAELQLNMADLLEKYFPEKAGIVIASYLKAYVRNFLLLDVLPASYSDLAQEYYAEQLTAVEARIKKREPEYVPLVRKSSDKNKTARIIQNCCYLALAVGCVTLLILLLLKIF